MEQTQEEIVGKLYALRAGLSVISEEADKLSDAEDETVEKYLAIAQKATGTKEESDVVLAFVDEYDRVSAAFGGISSFVHVDGCVIDGSTRNRAKRPALNKIIQKEQCYNCTDEDDEDYAEQQEKAEVCYAKWLGTNESVEYYENLKKHYSEDKKTGKGFGIFALIVAVLAIGVAVGLAFIHLFFITAIAAVVAVVCFILGIVFIKGKSEQKQVTVLNKLLSYIPIAQKETSQAEQQLAETAKNVKAVTVKLYSALEKEYSKLIDPRDWQYLDLVIYYFETGRAETMKEALQLVEREVQTQRIVGAIEMASERVCRTIASAAAVISSQLNMISLQLSAVIEQQDMQNALLTKSNATSEQLMSDVAYIKNYRT